MSLDGTRSLCVGQDDVILEAFFLFSSLKKKLGVKIFCCVNLNCLQHQNVVVFSVSQCILLVFCDLLSPEQSQLSKHLSGSGDKLTVEEIILA